MDNEDRKEIKAILVIGVAILIMTAIVGIVAYITPDVFIVVKFLG